VIRGDLASYIQDAHEKYGAAVRVAPEEISFISGETAWQDIYGFRTGKNKTPPYLKDGKWYTKLPNTAPSILIADEADHSRMRRNLSHAFSDKAIKEQEPLVQGLVDLLVNRLHEQVEENNPTVDIMRWYNYTTFDIITDLTFGEPLYCLRDKDYHPWVVMIAASMKINTIKARTKQFAAFVYIDMLMGLFIDKKALENKRMEFYGLISAKVSKRIAEGTQRPDFISHILRNEEKAELALTKPELDSNALILMVGGSETTATVLSGFTYLLLRHPLVYEKVVGEIRGRFTKLADITFEKVSQLEYLVATLQESMRVYPAVPTGFPRAVPAGGDTVSGVYVSEGVSVFILSQDEIRLADSDQTSVYMSQHAANHSKRNWTDPDTFVPERWLGDAKYKDDNRAVVHPFSFGPRNCLGKK